jgi:hypothetical protein
MPNRMSSCGRWGIHKALSGFDKLAFQTLLFESGLRASENVARSKVAHLLPNARTRNSDYNDDVRYYATKPIHGGSASSASTRWISTARVATAISKRQQ